mmetsp:Transcript_24127/g.44858  ORF Transcript_24127/g.44858 Transcript_24127/m.44858 type:complete len:88 (+) Transcript_24127:8047-8310(+)
MKRIVWLAVATLVAAILFYLSRFWSFSLWPRSGLFGIEQLRPQGGLVGRWLRGTDFAPFELLIWAIGAFLLLTVLQKLYDRMNPPPK